MASRTAVYDTGMLLAAEADSREAWLHHKLLLQRKAFIVVPAGVLAQAWRGGPQPLMSRMLGPCVVEPLGEAAGRAAGDLCAQAGTSDIVDANVVCVAAKYNAGVFTSDPHDLRHLADAAAIKLHVQRI